MLEELYRDLRDELIRWCTTMTQDRSTAEDLVQEAFWKAINNEAMLQTMTPPQRRAWLYQVVKNLFIDRTRHAAYEAVMEELPETSFLPSMTLSSARICSAICLKMNVYSLFCAILKAIIPQSLESFFPSHPGRSGPSSSLPASI